MNVEPVGAVGQLLRDWRGVRGVSQLDLALSAGVSSRHISFLETGRSSPSRAMVLRLAEALDLPLRERNALLVTAGFAPLYGQSRLDHERLAPVLRALKMMLRVHEPYPAFVLDRAWNILLANRSHDRMLPLFLPRGADPGSPVNAVRLLFDPALLRPRLLNWEAVAHILGHRVRRQLQLVATEDEGVRALLTELLDLPGVRDAMQRGIGPHRGSASGTEAVVPMQFDAGDGATFSWFSTIATLGTPQDVTVEELRIESLFPADEETDQRVRAIERPDGGR